MVWPQNRIAVLKDIPFRDSEIATKTMVGDLSVIDRLQAAPASTVVTRKQTIASSLSPAAAVVALIVTFYLQFSALKSQKGEGRRFTIFRTFESRSVRCAVRCGFSFFVFFNRGCYADFAL